MAESYLREIRELQPEGPYYFGGFCMGGQVAVEMAQKLVREGQQVNLLFLIDTHNFNGVPPKQGQQNPLAHFTEKSKIAVRRGIERLRITFTHLFRMVARRNVMSATQEHIDRLNDLAFLSFVPSVYPGKITICKPRRNYPFLRDTINGWGEIAAGGFEIIELRSDPDAAFIEPFVPVLAEMLRERLDRAFSTRTEAVKKDDLQHGWKVMHGQSDASSENGGRETRIYEPNA
jgi:thioesterase domain-containing protein